MIGTGGGIEIIFHLILLCPIFHAQAMGGDAQIISILHWMWYTLDEAQLRGVGGDDLTTALQAHFSLFKFRQHKLHVP